MGEVVALVSILVACSQSPSGPPASSSIEPRNAVSAPAEPVAIRSLDAGRRIVLLRGELFDVEGLELLEGSAVLIVDSRGGRIGEGFAIADALQENGVELWVPDGAVCMSACTILMAAASEVRVGPEADIIIHEVQHRHRYAGWYTNLLKSFYLARGWPADLVDPALIPGGGTRLTGRQAIARGLADARLCGRLDAADDSIPPDLAPC